MTASSLSTSTSWCPVVKLTGQSAREPNLKWNNGSKRSMVTTRNPPVGTDAERTSIHC